MRTIHYINTEEFISNHILTDGLTVIDIALEIDSYWTACVIDGVNNFYLSQPLVDDDCMIPMLFKSALDARNYIDNAVENFTGGL